MLYLWWRMDEEGRRRVWSLYGWFCGLLVCGSCFGAVTWAARMMSLVNGFEGNYVSSQDDFAAGDWLTALSYSWRAVFTVMYAIEFMCLSAARLMVLDRMSDFAAGQDEVARNRWAAGGRMVMPCTTNKLPTFCAHLLQIMFSQQHQRRRGLLPLQSNTDPTCRFHRILASVVRSGGAAARRRRGRVLCAPHPGHC